MSEQSSRPMAVDESAGAGFIGLLAALSALGQFGSNVFLPGLPAMTRELHVQPSQAALSFSLYLAVFGLAQLVAGPSSDRLGRRQVALFGAVSFLLGAGICALAPTLTILLGGRAIQAIGGACAVVVSRAVARDCFKGAALSRVMATTTIVFAAVPGFAPLLGGALSQYIGWRSTMWAAVVAALVVALWCWRQLPETGRCLISEQQGTVLSVYRGIITDRLFMQFAFVGALSLGAMSAFFGSSPRVFLEVLGISPVEYGFYPPSAITGFVIGGILVRRLGTREVPIKLLRAGAGLQLLACVVLAVPPWFGFLSTWQLNTGIVIFVTGLGIVMPVSIAAAMSALSGSVGQSSAVLGFVQMAIGAVGATLGNLGVDQWPMSGMQSTMACFAICNLTLVLCIRLPRLTEATIPIRQP